MLPMGKSVKYNQVKTHREQISSECHSLETQFSVVKKLFQSDQEIFYDCIKIFGCLYGHPHPYTRNILLTLTQVLLRRVRKTEKYQITTE